MSNPDDLKEVFRQAAYNTLGGRGFVDDAQIDQFVKAYQEQEIKAQRAAYDGGQVTDPPSASTMAEESVEAADPEGAEASRFAGYVGVLENLIGGGSRGGFG